jgi:hypothetical protein
MVGVSVTNLSTFSVTVVEMSLEMARTKDRHAFTQPLILDGKQWPCRLEARDTLTAYIDARGFDPRFNYTYAYARTACGTTFRYRMKKIPRREQEPSQD